MQFASDDLLKNDNFFVVLPITLAPFYLWIWQWTKQSFRFFKQHASKPSFYKLFHDVNAAVLVTNVKCLSNRSGFIRPFSDGRPNLLYRFTECETLYNGHFSTSTGSHQRVVKQNFTYISDAAQHQPHDLIHNLASVPNFALHLAVWVRSSAQLFRRGALWSA